jgi:imidazolonepropionase-like amidohydrolase
MWLIRSARGRKEDGFLLSAKGHYHHCVPILKNLVLASFLFTLGASAQQTLTITHVTVIDTVTGKTQPDTTVLIQGNRITGIAPSTAITPKTGQIVDGRGEYLIPGLWDMHTHVYEWHHRDSRHGQQT